MSAPATVEMGSMLSDFSKKLLNTADTEKKLKKKNTRQIDGIKGSGSKDLSDNFNLNSVLTKIRDNGSAYVDTIRKDAKQVNNAQKVAQQSNMKTGSYTGESQNKANYLNEEMVDDELHLSYEEKADVSLLHYITRTQLLSLIGFTAVIVGISMYMLDSHVDSSIQESVKNVNAVFPVKTHDVEKKMDGEILRASDGFMLSGTQVSGTQVSGTQVSETQAVDVNELALISSSMSDLAGEVRSLRKELKQVKESMSINGVTENTLINDTESSMNNLLETTSGPSINNSIAKVVSDNTLKPHSNNLTSGIVPANEKTIPSHENSLVKVAKGSSNSTLKVHLVSISNKTKANEIIKSLGATGLSPHIKEAVVDGKQIYRISFSGFKDKDKAKLFIQNAAKKFGIKGSQIRKN